MIVVDGLDHLVLTVADPEATIAFYRRVLGFRAITFGSDRTALRFGRQKLNLHAVGRELDPAASRPTPGSADLCFLTRTPLAAAIRRVRACGVDILAGPGPRHGAVAPLTSIYFRDPDGNLVEVANLQ